MRNSAANPESDKLEQAAKLIAEHINSIIDDLDCKGDPDAFIDIFCQLEFAIEDKVLAHRKS